VNTALRDINGIDPVGWWPPGPGWWVVAALLLLTLIVIKWKWSTIVCWIKQPRAPWRRDARKQLNLLRKRLTISDSKKIAAELSELLRRIAVARCGRNSCAGLSGKEWLQWLSDNDPKSFDWNSQGELLQQLTYAPPSESDDTPQFEQMIKAAISWTQAPECKGGGDV